MTNEIPVVPKKSRWKKVLRVLAIICVIGVVIAVPAHFAWKYSGSNQWVKKIDKNGITVYARKVPGNTLLDIKAIRRVKSTVGVGMLAIVAVDCSDWLPGKCSGRSIEPYDLNDQAETDYFVGDFPFPMTPREWLFRTQFTEDPKTGAILMAVKAVPDVLPPDKCCFRVKTLDNRWLLTPRENGEIEVEFEMHTDEGLPYFLMNPLKPYASYRLFEDLPRQFGKEKYRHATPNSWKEYLLANTTVPQHSN